MDKVSFFTAVSYGSQPKTFQQILLETVDDYFFFNGRKAFVIANLVFSLIEEPGLVFKNGVSPYLGIEKGAIHECS